MFPMQAARRMLSQRRQLPTAQRQRQGQAQQRQSGGLGGWLRQAAAALLARRGGGANYRPQQPMRPATPAQWRQRRYGSPQQDYPMRRWGYGQGRPMGQRY